MADVNEYDVLGGYLPSFVQHLEDTRARLGLLAEPQANACQASVGDVAMEGTRAHTDATSWTSAEQDAFFRAISVHSRWRPDLIAACVPTKSEWDVWMYLEALEDGAATLAAQREGEGENEDMDEDTDTDEDGDSLVDDDREMEMHVDSDSHAYTGSDADEDAEMCEPALEVSQAWIDAEERMASWIIDGERLASVEGDVDTDTEDDERQRGSSRGTSTSLSEHSQDLSTWDTQQRDVLMSRLELPHLQVLDSILRGREQAMKEQSKSREGSVTSATPLEHPHNANSSSRSDRITEPQETINIPESSSNMVTDLTLGVDPTGRRSGQVPSRSNETSGAPPHVPVQGSSLPPNVSSHPVSSVIPTEPGPSNAVPTGSNPNANAESDLSSLSPRSRRQIQKRLYMRRRRALLRGDGAASENIEKLKPGKKVRTEASADSITVRCSEAPSDAEGELPKNVPKRKSNVPGVTLPYKLKALFAEWGVDAAYLADQGMDLLNLGALGKFMGLCVSLELTEEEEAGRAICESIDAQLIRRLQAAVVSFVTDIVYKAIVWKEREKRLKQRNRAWRTGDQITVGTIEHAVEAIGARYHSHKMYLSALEARHGLSTEVSSAPANAADEPNRGNTSVDPGVGASDLVGKSPCLSFHRDVYTPLICPPSTWRISPLSCLTRTYEREAMRTRRGNAEVDEDELLSDETDEEALEDELEDEDEADARDMVLGTGAEKALWDLVSINNE